MLHAATCPYGAGTFTAPTGTITIPADYAASVTCEYLITTGAPIYLRFDLFATEADYDFIYVYDGASFTGTLLGKFSGTATPRIQIATSGSIFIRFTSDSGYAKGAIGMSWSDTMPTPAPTTPPTTPAPTTPAPTYSPDGTAVPCRRPWQPTPGHGRTNTVTSRALRCDHRLRGSAACVPWVAAGARARVTACALARA